MTLVACSWRMRKRIGAPERGGKSGRFDGDRHSRPVPGGVDEGIHGSGRIEERDAGRRLPHRGWQRSVTTKRNGSNGRFPSRGARRRAPEKLPKQTSAEGYEERPSCQASVREAGALGSRACPSLRTRQPPRYREVRACSRRVSRKRPDTRPGLGAAEKMDAPQLHGARRWTDDVALRCTIPVTCLRAGTPVVLLH
jgi:hypothetical protein